MDKSIPAFAALLLDFIRGIETKPDGYDVIYGNNEKKLKKRITQMTIAEVQQAQGTYRSLGIKSTATGGYQFMKKTLAGLIRSEKLDTSQKFDANLQDRLAFVLLRQRGYDAFVAGNIGVTEFAKRLAMEWASLPVLKATTGAHGEITRGQSYYAGDALNKSLVSAAKFEAVLKTKLPGAAGAKVTKASAPAIETVPSPVRAERPPLWSSLWSWIRGKGVPVVTTPEKARPGLSPAGDPVLYDQQKMLSDKGWTEVGQPDGLMGGKTVTAIRAFRAETGLPASDAIDEKFSAALLAAGPRQVAKARADATPQDLRKQGNSQVANLDGIGSVGKWLIGLAIGGAAENSGVLGGVSDTLQSAQDTLGTITTILTTIISVASWCFSHWYLFAGGLAVYIVFKAVNGVLDIVLKFQQGFLQRADK